VCIGTSATMSSADREDDRNQTVAEVASLLFGTGITALDVIGETLERVTNPTRDIAAVKPMLQAALRSLPSWADFDAFKDDPLAIWVELSLGIDLPTRTSHLAGRSQYPEGGRKPIGSRCGVRVRARP
jgi:hypothetical protein